MRRLLSTVISTKQQKSVDVAVAFDLLLFVVVWLNHSIYIRVWQFWVSKYVIGSHSRNRSWVECVEHVEEEDAEEPNGDEDIIGSDGHILSIFFDLYDQGHSMEYENTDECDPCEYCMIYTVVKKVDAQKSYV